MRRAAIAGRVKTALCALLLSASVAVGGLERYSELVVADAPGRSVRGGVRVTYLGTNGYQLEANGHAIWIDPYFSRVGICPVAFNARIQPVRARLESARAKLHPRPEAILVTHAHFDHLLDVPPLLRGNRARLIAGPSAAFLVEACGVPRDRMLPVEAGSRCRIGPWKIHALRAEHDHLLGSEPPFPGTLTKVGKLPERPSHWVLGEPLAFLIEANGCRIYIDSGGRPGTPPPPGISPVDLAIPGVALPDSRRRYAEAVRRLRPRYVLPSHQDDFFRPLDRGFVFGKLTNFPAVRRMHAREQLPGTLILLDYFRPWTLP
jgi:L-ascorbate metabolism protein UlaG (beta-lactamase superfamily)